MYGAQQVPMLACGAGAQAPLLATSELLHELLRERHDLPLVDAGAGPPACLPRSSKLSS